MSITTISLTHEQISTWDRCRAYVQLTKPRIGLLVLLTVVVSGTVASWGQPNPIVLVHAALGTALVAASGSALNQWLERRRDGLMPRTAERPLPTGTLSSSQVIWFAAMTNFVGLIYLLVLVNWQTAVLGLLTWGLYVWAYTPLKTRTGWNTVVGAVPGALPVAIGWAAAEGTWDLRAAALFLIVFLWQFPHFMAIAWIYRDEYARAGIRMISVLDPSGKRAGLQAVSGALAVIPVSYLLAAYSTPTSLPYVIATMLLGSWQLLAALIFFFKRSDQSARRLLRVSLLYLPVMLVLTLCLPLI